MQLTRRDLFKGAAAAGALASLAAGEPDPAHGFRLGIISDEISTNLDEAVEFITSGEGLQLVRSERRFPTENRVCLQQKTENAVRDVHDWRAKVLYVLNGSDDIDIVDTRFAHDVVYIARRLCLDTLHNTAAKIALV